MGLFNILVDVAASTASFESGMKRVENQLESLGDTARKALEFAGIGIGLHELVADFDEFVDHAESLEHAAQKTGLLVDQLSQLQFAAGQTGLSADQLTNGIERFAKTVETATQSSGQQRAAFDAMGISITDSLGKLKPVKTLLDDVATKFASYSDGLEKTALAQILFGRSGADLIPLLDKGAEGLDALAKRSDELGNTINDNTAKAADAFNSKLGELHAVAQGFWNLTAQQLLPALTALTDQFVGGGAAANKFNQEVQPLVNGLKFIVDVGFSAEHTLSRLGDALGALAAIATRPIREAGNIWKDYLDRAVQAEQNANKFLDLLWGDDIDKSAQWRDNLVADWGLLANAAKTAAPLVVLASDDMADAWRKLDLQADKTFASNAQKISDSVLGQTDSIRKGPVLVKTLWDQIDEISQTGAKQIQGSFADFLFDPASKGFSGLVSDFATALRRMVADAAAAGIFKALFGTDKEGNSNLGGTLGGFLQSLFGGGKAAGGPLESGKWYVAGEHGPEPIWGGGSGAYAAGYGGGGAPSLTLNNYVDARGATTDFAKALPGILKANNDAFEAKIVTKLKRNAYGFG